MSNGKFYWLKLKRDFFKRTDIKVVENMPNGKDYILFYLKLLLESVEYEGKLRLSDTIPYNEEMLSTITDTDIDVVRSAMNIFTKLNMIDVLDDQTIYMTEIQNMIGCETKWAEKKRQYREKIGQKEDNVLALSDKSIEIEKELEIEKEKENDISPNVDISLEKENKPKKKKFIPPTIEEVRAYCLEKGYDIDAEHFINFYESKGWYVGKNKMVSWKACVGTWVKNNKKQQTKVISDNPYEDMLREEGIYYDENRSNYFIE